MADIIPVIMIRENLADIPQYPLPQGFSVRNFKRGEGDIWAQINADAGGFATFEDAQSRFAIEFADPVNDMESRCFFIFDDSNGQAIGTAMAWYDSDFCGQLWGRVHWVAILPQYQGRGLAKPLLTSVLNRMAEYHDKVVLGTQTFRRVAINLYLDLGFKPFLSSPTCRQAWNELAAETRHPALIDYIK